MDNIESAIIVCTQFMDAWKRKNWRKLLKYCQVTWVEEGHPNLTPLKWVISWYGSRVVPISYEVIDYELKDDTTIDAVINVTFKTGIKQIKARIICEKGAYEPSIDGTWGVNPISCLRKNNVKVKSP